MTFTSNANRRINYWPYCNRCSTTGTCRRSRISVGPSDGGRTPRKAIGTATTMLRSRPTARRPTKTGCATNIACHRSASGRTSLPLARSWRKKSSLDGSPTSWPTTPAAIQETFFRSIPSLRRIVSAAIGSATWRSAARWTCVGRPASWSSSCAKGDGGSSAASMYRRAGRPSRSAGMT